MRIPVPRAAGRLLATLALLVGGSGPARAQFGGDLDVPFITTPDQVTLAMLQLAGVGPSDRLVDLGSGDGRIVITAARRFGARGLGVEIVPDLVARSRANAQKAGVADRAEFRVQDLFDTDLSAATVVTLYLLPEVNLQLRPRLLALPPGTRIVSHDWDMADWQPDRTLVLDVPDKPIGRDKRSRLHLWRVPARLQGLWCGPGGVALRLQQRFQQVAATLAAPLPGPTASASTSVSASSASAPAAVTGAGVASAPVAASGPVATELGLQGRVDGTQLRLLGAGRGDSWLAEATADGTLQVQQSPPGAPLQAGQRLRLATGSGC